MTDKYNVPMEPGNSSALKSGQIVPFSPATAVDQLLTTKIPSVDARHSKSTIAQIMEHQAARHDGTPPRKPSSYPPPSVSDTPDDEKKRPGHMYPKGDFRNNSTADLLEIKTDMMCSWLHQQQLENMWSTGGAEEGVMIKKERKGYMCSPKALHLQRGGFYDSLKELNVKCAMTVNTRIVKLILYREDIAFVPLDSGLYIQILPDMAHLPQCQKHQFASFIRSPLSLVVWDDDPNHLIVRIQSLEDQLINKIWKEQDAEDDRAAAAPRSKAASRNACLHNGESSNGSGLPMFDQASRRTVLIQPVLTALTLILLTAVIGQGWRRIAIEFTVDKKWTRLAFAAVVPLQCWLALFFVQCMIVGIAQLVGPISQMKANTKFFSGEAPPRLHSNRLPHVTIQCPVYKEGLWTVIDPTIKSIKAAISTYEMQGGSANIFVNDDGMQLMSPSEAHDRRDYYDEHNIGWVARPKHDPNPADSKKAFIRAGKFKKASNMNHALNVTVKVEDEMALIDRSAQWSQALESESYDAAFAKVINDDYGRTWAGGDVRVGDYILLIDSDTRVPVDCFLDAVSEMDQSPQVAIIQFSSGVMNVTASWFERAITFFVNMVYTAIQFAVSNGDVAPFMGHNAFLRWSAIQDVAYLAEDGVTERYWSESTVSEDFDMALRLQTSGYILRLATYAGDGFKEGVSLTVYDELARWKKYAYGCSELIFHPFALWLRKGPFTPLFRHFFWSSVPLPSKLTIMAYMGTYYAIGSAWILTLVNYCIVGWYNGHLDHYYIDSFKIYFAIIMVFSALGNVALAVLRYRVEERSLLSAIVENFKWIPLLTVFLGGISFHVSGAILCHLFSIDISWGATAKEAKDTNFFQEVPVILKEFRVIFTWCLVLTTAMVILAGVGPLGMLVPYDWQINMFIAIWPLATVVGTHFLLPLVLNPGLMQFTF